MERESYRPGPAGGARVDKAGAHWTLILVRRLRHPPAKVWQALTDPALLHQWAPFDADGNLGQAGNSVKLTTVATPQPQITETTVKRARVRRSVRSGSAEVEASGGGLTAFQRLPDTRVKRTSACLCSGWPLLAKVQFSKT